MINLCDQCQVNAEREIQAVRHGMLPGGSQLVSICLCWACALKDGLAHYSNVMVKRKGAA